MINTSDLIKASAKAQAKELALEKKAAKKDTYYALLNAGSENIARELATCHPSLMARVLPAKEQGGE